MGFATGEVFVRNSSLKRYANGTCRRTYRYPANVMVMNELLLSEDGILKRIQRAQNSDDFIKSIKKILQR